MNNQDFGLDISVYTNPQFTSEQMEEIRLGLEDGLDVSQYAKSEYSGKQMKEIRLGLLENKEKSLKYGNE